MRPSWSPISPADRSLIVVLKWAARSTREIAGMVGRHTRSVDKVWETFRRSAVEVSQRPVVTTDGQRYEVVWHGAARGAGGSRAKMDVRATYAALTG